ncbi:MAG: WecB/TagA/CpsF family glycosyltransferase [Candidatus Doudnabacteria bacterium]|nr:WecB/TagA/CpsF family glycosyltransferase [Candidatus Doudnabacteria bacterium]
MNKVDIAGLKINAVAKVELLAELRDRISRGQKTWLTTPYSEFLHAALLDPEIMRVLNSADLAIADGIGLFWAYRYLSIPLIAKSYWGKILQSGWQIIYSLAAIIFRPRWIKSSLPEKIPGSDLIWDLAKLAAENNYSIYLLGGFGDTAQLAAAKLHRTDFLGRENPSDGKVAIAGISNKNPEDKTIIDDINNSSPGILLVAFGPIKQEQWIAKNLPELKVNLVVGLGGTFDYLAGKQPQPPQFLRQAGLEWLWRLFTQPKRVNRIRNATIGLAMGLWRYKVMMNLPFRQNVVSAVINQNGEVLVAKFNSEKKVLKALGYSRDHFKKFWQFPQGGIESDESIPQASKRELFEETGMKNVFYLGSSEKTYSYIWEDPARRPLLIKARYQYKGQFQHIAYFKFLGNDTEIKLDAEELTEYKWVKPENLVTEIHSQKAAIAKIIQEDLKEMAKKAII